MIKIPEIKLAGDGLSNSSDMRKALRDAFVDLDQKIEHPEVLLSVGIDQKGFPIPISTAGEFSCTVAPSKTKKSFLKSLLAASFIGGNTNNFTSHIKGHRSEDFFILDIDTEQSKFYAHRAFMRTRKLCGLNYPNYVPLQIRKLSPLERLRLTDWLLTESGYAGKIKIVFIDGIVDYLDDMNNLVMSNEVATYLLKWTDELNIHIHCIIHKVNGADRANGHIGTVVTKKAETLIFIDPITDQSGKISNYNTVKVRCGVSRGKMFDPFYLSVNSDGLPVTHDNEFDNIEMIGKPDGYSIEKNIPALSLSEAFPKLENEFDDDISF